MYLGVLKPAQKILSEYNTERSFTVSKSMGHKSCMWQNLAVEDLKHSLLEIPTSPSTYAEYVL